MSLTDSASAGLNAAQQTLGAVGQNLANSNTMGYKESAPIFQQLYEETLSGGTAPTTTTGGTNPIQVAAGGSVGLAAMETDESEGSIDSTGVPSNLAISGNGYFVVQTGNGQAYRRSGDFTLNAQGTLVDSNGDEVQGWSPATVSAGTQDALNLTTLSIPVNSQLAPSASANLTVTGNLDASTLGATVKESLPITVYDSQGNAISATLQFSNPTAAAPGVTWTVGLSYGSPPTSLTGGTFTFNPTATPQWTGGPFTFNIPTTDGSTNPLAVKLAATDLSQLTSYAATETAAATADGYPSGTLTNYSIGNTGVITGTYSNGETQTLGQIALAVVPNQQGMALNGNNNYIVSPNAGTPQVGQAGSGPFGSLVGGSLEASNVNMSQQFTAMIGAQEDFSANSKLLTVDQQDDSTLIGSVQ